MAQARGYKTTVDIDFENNFGQDNGTPAALTMPINSDEVRGDLGQEQPQTVTGTRNPVEPIDLNMPVDGPLVVPVDYSAFGWWLKAMFGAPTTTGTGPYNHVFTVTDAQPSFVKDRKIADASAAISYIKHNGCKIGRWDLGISGAGGELISTFQIAASKEITGASAYDSGPTAQSFNRLHMKPCTVTEGGSGQTGLIKAVNFSIDFGLDTDQFTVDDAGLRGDIPEGMMALTGNVEALFKNTTLMDKAINRTESSLSLAWSSGSYSLTVAFNEIKYGRRVPVHSGPGGVMLDQGFSAYYKDHADASAVTVTLVSDVSSFA